MPIDIYNKEFQNWLKGVFSLNTTRDALCKCVVEKLGDYIKDIPKEILDQFFCCLRLNGIMQLKTQKKGPQIWRCEHEKCRELMDRFVEKHAERRIPEKYQWILMQSQAALSQSNLENMESSDVVSQYDGNRLIWNVATLYMFVEKGETTEKYQNLDNLDISKVIKLMSSCKIFIPDGSLEHYEAVKTSRNEVMHSSKNQMMEKNTKLVLEGARKLLKCLGISDTEYYKEAIQELQDSTGKKGLEFKPAEYKSLVKDSLEKKQETIASDKCTCDEDTELYSKLQELGKKAEQDLKDVHEVLQKKDSEEMVEMIDNLHKEVKILKESKKDISKEVENLSKEVETLQEDKKIIEEEVKKYKEENTNLKALNLSMNQGNVQHIEQDSETAENIDTSYDETVVEKRYDETLSRGRTFETKLKEHKHQSNNEINEIATASSKSTLKEVNKRDELDASEEKQKKVEIFGNLQTISSNDSDSAEETFDDVKLPRSDNQEGFKMDGRLPFSQKLAVERFIGTGAKYFNILYSFTRDGAAATTFHQKCDNRGPTVTVIYNTKGSVYGGYIERSWVSDDEAYYRDDRAFLFSLMSNGKVSFNKFPVKNSDKAFYCNKTYGPVFGSGFDLKVFSESLTEQGTQYTLNGSMNMGIAYDMNGISTEQVTDNIKTVLDVEVYSLSESPLSNIWRETPGWDWKDLEDLKHFAASFVPPPGLGIDMANILVIGPVGAGKSSFFNTIASVFRGHISDQAVCGSAEYSITSKYRMYHVRGSQTEKPLNFCLCDTMGLEESQGLDAHELTYILDGHVPDGYQFNTTTKISSEIHGFVKSPTLENKIHHVCFVFDGNTATILSEKMLKKVKRMQAKVRRKGLPQSIVLTKIDKVCSYVDVDVKNVYQSDTIRLLVNEVLDVFRVPHSFILPLKNYEKEFDVKADVSILAMQTLKCLLVSTEKYLFNFFN